MARARDVVARRPNVRAGVFGYWGAEDPRSLAPEAVAGFLEAQPEHEDIDSASRALRHEDPRTYLNRVRCPALVVWGARDRLVPLEDGYAYARLLPAPLRIVPAAGHLVVGEYPRECLRPPAPSTTLPSAGGRPRRSAPSTPATSTGWWS